MLTAVISPAAVAQASVQTPTCSKDLELRNAEVIQTSVKDLCVMTLSLDTASTAWNS